MSRYVSISDLAITTDFLKNCRIKEVPNELPDTRVVDIITPANFRYRVALDGSELAESVAQVLNGASEAVAVFGTSEPEDRRTTVYDDGMRVVGNQANYIRVHSDESDYGPAFPVDDGMEDWGAGDPNSELWASAGDFSPAVGDRISFNGGKNYAVVDWTSDSEKRQFESGSPIPLTEQEIQRMSGAGYVTGRMSGGPGIDYQQLPRIVPARPEKGFSWKDKGLRVQDDGTGRRRLVREEYPSQSGSRSHRTDKKPAPKLINLDFSDVEAYVLRTIESKRNYSDQTISDIVSSQQRQRDKIRTFSDQFAGDAPTELPKHDNESMILDQEILEVTKLRDLPTVYDDSTPYREKLRRERLDRVLGRLEQRREELRMVQDAAFEEQLRLTKAREIWEQLKVLLEREHALFLRTTNPFCMIGENEADAAQRLRPIGQEYAQVKYMVESARRELLALLRMLTTSSDETQTWWIFIEKGDIH